MNRLDDAIFDAAYPGGGRDSYHPKMLTKVIIYAYAQRIKNVLEKVFTAVLQFLADEKYVSLEYYFVDGTYLFKIL